MELVLANQKREGTAIDRWLGRNPLFTIHERENPRQKTPKRRDASRKNMDYSLKGNRKGTEIFWDANQVLEGTSPAENMAQGK